MWIGFFLIGIGILILLNNMGWIRGDIWGYVWPLFLILLGLSMILKRIKNRPIMDETTSGESSKDSDLGPGP